MPQKYDLHTHFYTNWEKGKFSLERKERSIKHILDAMRKKGLDGIVLTNAGEEGGWKDAYEQITGQTKDKAKLGKYKFIKNLGNALEFADEERLYKIIKGQEVLTKHGHIVAIGLDYGKIIQSRLELENALNEIINLGAVSDATHAFGFAGIGKENLFRYRSYLDVFEGKNMNYEHLILRKIIGVNPSEELNDISKQLGMNWIAVSDCHNYKDVGNGHIEVDGGLIDFSSNDNLKDSLRYLLVSEKFKNIVKKANPLTSVVGHMIIYSYDVKLRNKLGWVNLEGAY